MVVGPAGVVVVSGAGGDGDDDGDDEIVVVILSSGEEVVVSGGWELEGGEEEGEGGEGEEGVSVEGGVVEVVVVVSMSGLGEVDLSGCSGSFGELPVPSVSGVGPSGAEVVAGLSGRSGLPVGSSGCIELPPSVLIGGTAVVAASGVSVVVVVEGVLSGSGAFEVLSVLAGGVVPSGETVVVVLSGCSGLGVFGLGELLPSVLGGNGLVAVSGVGVGVVILSGCSGLGGSPLGEVLLSVVLGGSVLTPSGVAGVVVLSGLGSFGELLLPLPSTLGGNVVAFSGVGVVVVVVVTILSGSSG